MLSPPLFFQNNVLLFTFFLQIVCALEPCSFLIEIAEHGILPCDFKFGGFNRDTNSKINREFDCKLLWDFEPHKLGMCDSGS